MIRVILLMITFSLINYPNLFAQVIVGGNPTFAPAEFSSQIIDESQQNIYYQYTFAKNPEEKSNTRSSLTVLQIGKSFSKFTDIYTIKLDSVKEKQSHLKSIGKSELNEQLSYRNSIGFKTSVIKEIKKSNFILQARIPSNEYQYNIEKPILKWNLESAHKTILGYKVKKATVNYSGRNWTAWFAESIPINLGPYIFGELPGLIMELYDEENNFHFVVNGINSQKEEIYLRNEKSIIKTSKEKFLKTENSYHERPSLFLKGTSGEKNELKKIPYNPIELIN